MLKSYDLTMFFLWFALPCFLWPNSVQGDRNRAIRVQQEPLRFYEEAQRRWSHLEVEKMEATCVRKKSWNLHVMFPNMIEDQL